jgi:hypothetical protein
LAAQKVGWKVILAGGGHASRPLTVSIKSEDCDQNGGGDSGISWW